MKRVIYFLLVLLVVMVLFYHCSHQDNATQEQEEFPILTGPYLGQKVPGLDPEMFAPGIVSTGLMEGVCNFTPDGKEVYYNTAYSIEDEWKLSIVYSKEVDGKWIMPDFVSFTDRKYIQAYPFLSYDGTKLYFTSNMPTNDPELKDEYNFWVSKREGDIWGEPTPLPPPINGRGDTTGISVSNTGVFYYTLITEKEQAIYRSRYKDGVFSEPERLPDSVNSTNSQFDGVIAPDESYMILPVYNREDSFGSTDLYVTFRDENDNWTPVVNLGSKINTKFTESAARITADGKYMVFTGMLESHNWGNDSLSFGDILNYYTKPGYGNPDIYWVDIRFLDQFRPKED
ncbi:MAG: PD40 domain-containing protein [Candidatus Aminicenantes bacterium]|nr:MAG: PD40 domain-containing protein [Candidatus Aminicenantes bacterium]